MLIICDFDGTVTADDTNSALARRFAPDRFAALAGALAARSMTLRDVLTAELGAIAVGIGPVLDVALDIPIRAGFGNFVAAARARSDEVVLLSSGFRQVIEPMLAAAGLAGVAPLIANDIEFGAAGASITWRELPTCEHCGEPCKRHDVATLRAGTFHEGRSFEHVVFVGDGFSDRCGAESADRVFARASLARYLSSRGVPWESFETFDDVTDSLYGDTTS